ncbi:MAG: TatD family hydrolase [Bacteroidaceae bacterium]|nr:TatD family hydrolase [Bacteroidaceae bacterium]
MSPFVDIHTHQHHGTADIKEVVCLDFSQLHTTYSGDFNAICKAVIESGPYIALGIHPWNAGSVPPDFTEVMRSVVQRCPNIMSIGEAGLDKTHSIDMGKEEAVFVSQIELSEESGLPMVIHCVKAFNELLRIRKQLSPKQRWIIHGFRGKAQQAEQLLRAGMDLSLGERFNPETIHVVPLERLWLETDMSDTPLMSVYSAVSKAMGIHLELLADEIHQRFSDLLSKSIAYPS